MRKRWSTTRTLLTAAITLIALASAAVADEWPQWRGPQRDGVWRETGIIDAFADKQIKYRWSVPVSGGYSGPTVADGRVYIMDRVTEPAEQERILCFDWYTGRQLWSYAYDCPYGKLSFPTGPRAAVSISDGRAYSIGSLGHMVCLDAATGKLLWRKNPGEAYNVEAPYWGMAASPLVEGDVVIGVIGAGDGACIMAFDKVTGEEKWRAINDSASYSSPVAIDQAGRRVVVCWTGKLITGLDPATGKTIWSYSFPPIKGVIGIADPAVHGQWLLVSSFYDGALMLRLGQDTPSVEKVWHQRGESEVKTEGLHCLMSTPIVDETHVYGIDSYGTLRCLDAQTGERVWSSSEPIPEARWANVHMVRNGDRTWLFNELGELIIAELSPEGYKEISRAKLIEPTKGQFSQRGGACWTHPAFAYGHVFVRNDRELVCADLSVRE